MSCDSGGPESVVRRALNPGGEADPAKAQPVRAEEHRGVGYQPDDDDDDTEAMGGGEGDTKPTLEALVEEDTAFVERVVECCERYAALVRCMM